MMLTGWGAGKVNKRGQHKRFMIVVFNYGRIESLIANLHKIKDIDYSLDTLVIYDCSEDSGQQLSILTDYCKQNELQLGQDILVKRRPNWGMAEGGRLDLATELRETQVPHRFLLQFQEHYLDTTSSCSLWPAGTVDLEGKDVSGKVKEDCIKSGYEIKLDKYSSYLDRGFADALYCTQAGVGLFPYWAEMFFCIDGVNFASSIETFLNIFDEESCIRLKATYDGTYEWILFAEHYVGYRIMKLGLRLCDIYYDISFRNPVDIIKGLREDVDVADLIHVSERYYARLFHRYMEKMASRVV